MEVILSRMDSIDHPVIVNQKVTPEQLQYEKRNLLLSVTSREQHRSKFRMCEAFELFMAQQMILYVYQTVQELPKEVPLRPEGKLFLN